MRKLITILAFIPFCVNAQNNFKAVIKDSESKEKLIGVTAYINELKIGATSDTSGTLTISNIPNGNYKIVFSYLGYEKTEMNFIFPLASSVPTEILLKNDKTMCSIRC